MKPRQSLATRIFLFAMVTVFLVAAAGIVALNQALRGAIRERLKKNFQTSSERLNKVASDYRLQRRQMLSVLSQNAGLKAAMGLLRELPPGRRESAQARRTIEASLFEIGKGLDYQLLMVTDASGRVVAGAASQTWGTVPLDPLPDSFEAEPLIEIGGTLYETTAVPINLGDENLGGLIVAREFDIASASPSGMSVLLNDHRTLLTTFPDSQREEIDAQLRRSCMNKKEGCEIRSGGETFLALPLERPDWAPNVKLFGFQSLDAAMDDFTRGFLQIFLWIGAVGLLSAALLSLVGARSVSQPLTRLSLQLKETHRAGRLTADFPLDSSLEEVHLLAVALNDAANAVEESNRQLDRANLEFLETMARALDARDPYTAGHSDRVSANATAIAQAMRLSGREVEIVRVGAKMHDIGKIGIPDAVLQKRGPLNEEEFTLIKLHPQIGKRILEKVEAFREYLPTVELHHEDFDGRGYPYGLTGEQVPLGVRIVHVADVYDAITSDRAYRSAMPPDRVLEIMRGGAGTKFDPAVIEVFLSLLRERQTLDRLLSEVQPAPCYEPRQRIFS